MRPPRVSVEDLLALALRYCAESLPGRQPLELTIRLQDGAKVRHSLLGVAGLVSDETPPPTRRLPPARHSADFASVHWYGTDYTFSPGQSAIVKQLWEAWENGTPEVRQETLLTGAGLESPRLVDVFEGSAAWGALIVPGRRGTYRLAQPE